MHTTISIDGVLWELDQGFLAGRIVSVGRCLADVDVPPWVEHEGKRLELHPVDPGKNARTRRESRHPDGAVPTRKTVRA